MTTKPRRNPQDSTRRNVAASAKRDAALLERIRKLETRMAWLEKKQPAAARL